MPGDEVLRAVEAALIQRFGATPARASVSFVGLERLEVLRWRSGAIAWLATLGASRHPMSAGDSMHVDPVRGPRAEILVRVRDDGGASAALVRAMAVVAASPAVESMVLRPDATIDLGAALGPGSRCTGFLLGASDAADVDPGIPGVEPVSLLEAWPVTAHELAWARARGAAALRDQLVGEGVDIADLGRRSASLLPAADAAPDPDEPGAGGSGA
ncbi:MAG: suppressor of fused domain protein [Frankiaceae bacterium]|jgi:hypothetical protein|nr:suppressor of fused domain protein [Frankiaceae bacterium]